MKTKWDNEKELAAAVINQLKEEGWTTYQEVGGIDIVARKDDKIIAIEAKKHFNLKVIDQAYKNINFVNESWVAVSSGWKTLEDIGLMLAKKINVGVMFVAKTNYYQNGDYSIKYVVNRQFTPESINIKSNSIKKILHPDAQNYAESGSSGGKQWSNFTLTVSKFKAYIAEHPGCGMTEALKNIDHHYSNKYSATSAMYKMLARGVIKGVDLIDGKLYIK